MKLMTGLRLRGKVVGAIFGLSAVVMPGHAVGVEEATRGFQGIWFDLGQVSAYGDKYSGGLGTYTANHTPIAMFAPEVNKTFFVYGGTRADGERYLLSMAASYDHATGLLSRPVVVHDHAGVDDPHDNPSLMIAADGRLWVFVSGRSTRRLGHVYRSVRPYDATEFAHVRELEFTYPQPMYFAEHGFVLMHTIYENRRNRHLFVSRSADGVEWSMREPVAQFGGHYQVSGRQGGRIATFFNRHPEGNVDRRTDLYYLQSDDLGRSWTTAGGGKVVTPLVEITGPALVRDLTAEGKLMYGMDLNFDGEGRPILLYLTAEGAQPGPDSGERQWWVSHWTGEAWAHHRVAKSLHNYSTGSVLVGPEGWRVVGPTGIGPQRWGSGGEIQEWVSTDEGRTWTLARDLTRDSASNHNYVRRVAGGRDGFEVLWADGNADAIGPSRLFFAATRGGAVWRMPETMPEAKGPAVQP